MNDIQAFIAVAREKSFTRAAISLGVSPSALSHTIRNLEARIGVRLLARTTRNVAPTEAGARLLHAVAPLFEQINSEIERIGELRDTPAGNIRITCSDDAAESLLRPVLAAFLEKYPDISVEIYIDYGFTNIVTERFDAGNVYAWEFEKEGRKLNVRVNGPFLSNSIVHVLNGALDGIGLAYVPENMAKPWIESGQLIEVLADWSPMFEGFHLYYPNRRDTSSAFAAFVDAVRYKEKK